MAFEHKDGHGSLFKNHKKEKEAQPDLTGDAKIGGVEYKVSAWVKDGKKGKFYSMAFTPKTAGAETYVRKEAKHDNHSTGDMPDAPPLRNEDVDDSSLPF